MEQVKNITPYSAAELTRKYFNWKELVQECLDSCVPCYCWKGLRKGIVSIPLKIDITPADAIRRVHPILRELGWNPSNNPKFNSTNNEIQFDVEW